MERTGDMTPEERAAECSRGVCGRQYALDDAPAFEMILAGAIADAIRAAVEAERERLKEIVRYWSYCTWSGIQRECPEKANEFADVCRELGISPYGSESKSP
jgi:hypothetical protein